jgi:AP-4 complex subunit sigma-1
VSSPALRIKAMIKFVLMVNKQGQTRLASYFEWFPIQERVALEAEIIRRCLSRTEYQCSFIEYRGYKVVYRRYASLFFVVAVDSDDDNELSLLEFIHSLVETMDKYFESVCELDVSLSLIYLLPPHLSPRQIMFHIEKAYYIVDEMVANGYIVENNKANILKPLQLMDKMASEESIFSRR